jgi:threonine/homoserine/homoserine lactone efflux protein
VGRKTVVTVIGQILPAALGVAISPFPMTAAILMLFSRRATANGLAFLAGWILGLMVLTIVALRVADAGNVSGGGTPSTAASTIGLLLGVLLVAMAVWEWKHRPKEGEQPKTPKWLAEVSGFTTAKAFGLALLLSAVNPKSFALAVAAALTIAAAGLSAGRPWIALLVFIAVGSLSIGVPVLYRLVAGEGAERALTSWKAWLIASNATIMSVLLLILGLALIGKGFVELS